MSNAPRYDTELHFIRHAEAASNLRPLIVCGRSNDIPLTGLGEQQAFAGGESAINSLPLPDEIYSSTAVRAQETARLFLSGMGLTAAVVLPDASFLEMSQGDWEGTERAQTQHTDEVRRDMARLGRNFTPPNGESMNDVGIRMFTRINAIEPGTLMEPKVVYVFSHTVAIRSLAALIHNWSAERTYTSKVPNVSDTLFLRSQGRWVLRHLGRPLQNVS